MKQIQQIGIYTFVLGIVFFTVNIFLGEYTLNKQKAEIHFDVTPHTIDKGDTIAQGFIQATEKFEKENSVSSVNVLVFNKILPQVIAIHNHEITRQLLPKYGITDEELKAVLSEVKKQDKIVYTEEVLDNVFGENNAKKQLLKDNTSWMFSNNKTYSSITGFKRDFKSKIEEINAKVGQEYHISTESWNLLELNKLFITSGAKSQSWLWFFLTFGLAIIGALAYNLPNIKLLGVAGIKHNGIYNSSITNRGWLAWIVLIYLVAFYVVLYFYPQYLANNVLLVNPISRFLSGNEASQWFLYGFIYCIAMILMAVRMYIKYRHNNYQIVRTTVVLFFQIIFAFLLPEILVRFNMPWYDFKNAWPLDYDFFFQYNIDTLIKSGNIGLFMLVWGIVLSFIIVPVLVYFYGKRWYCSWVCGCGGLAETLGDPFRQHSDKSLKAWKLERYLIYSVLVFAVVMTIATLYTFFTGVGGIFGISTYTLQKTYGFLIGAIFSGVIGTGFYPVFGSRTWCRFGCPLAAYMGIIQRFKSRFRITTNGSQCISCGNCSTYCEQGIDVRAYAQKGLDIVRSSCVGCGVCSAVCPRGVLKLENTDTPKKLDIRQLDEWKGF